MGNLTGKVAIVTGASKGIGAAIARGLAGAGASVVVNYSSSRQGAERVVDAIKSNGGKAIAVQGDVAKSGRRAFRGCLRKDWSPRHSRHSIASGFGETLDVSPGVLYCG